LKAVLRFRSNYCELMATTASGILSLLDENHPEIREFALRKLNEIVNSFWPEIAATISKIEILYEDETFRNRELAALVASKVYYHLEQYNTAMSFALGAGKLFDVSQNTEYSNALVAKFIDEYIRLRTEQAETKDVSLAVSIDPRLEAIVFEMFNRCFLDKKFKQALGIALETRQLDQIERAIVSSDDVPNMLRYCQVLCMEIVLNRDFRQKVLRLLTRLYNELKVPDYLRICEILVFLNDHRSVIQILESLLNSEDEEKHLVAFQICFELVGNGTQQFLRNVRSGLTRPPTLEADKASLSPSPSSSSVSPLEQKEQTKPMSTLETEPIPSVVGVVPIVTEAQSTKVPFSSSSSSEKRKLDGYTSLLEKAQSILSGDITIELYLDFLFRNNHIDLPILNNIKNVLENSRATALHTSTIFANALMHAGTTSDSFLRDNLEWLSKATNWAKFSAIAGLGVIHKGHLKKGLSLLGPYLPQAGVSGSAYSEGGSLYALGIIHANHGQEIVDYLTRALNSASGNEIVQHGACLGLGLAAMATGDDDVYESLKNVMYLDSAVAGEAASLSMGLVMLGSASEKAISEMLAYAHDTQHEKIIRGLALGMAMVMYGREEEADTLIEQLLLDKDPLLRYGSMYTIAMAYCGTANNNAIRRLLHVAVSDVSDDVRRAAVTAIGFLLFKQPEQCPKIVSLLAESYNPHVRYGACLALGIACASSGGSALNEAIDILEPLTTDAIDYVRQGALIALSMVLMQANKLQEPKSEQIRKLIDEKITDKHEDIMCKFGAVLAAGILDAGGRNVTIVLHSRSGHKNMSAIIGLAIFAQFWYWYPFIHFISLAFTPTAFIGLNKDLKMPVFKFKSNVRPSLFAYPASITPPTTSAVSKVHTAVLSITKRREQRDKKLEEKKKGTDAMEIDANNVPQEKKEMEKESDNKGTISEDKKKEADSEKKKKETEPDFEIKANPSRVTLAQLKYLSFDADERYTPIRTENALGIVLLRNLKPEEDEEFVSTSNINSAPKQDEEEEAKPPEPFEYDPLKG